MQTYGKLGLTVALLAAFLPVIAQEPAGFSHDDWTEVLERFVDNRGLVDYVGLSKDGAVFDRYLRSIEQVSPESDPDRFPTRNHALAYYINASNAHVFNGVLARGPEEESVWRGLVSGFSFFVRMRITVGGLGMSLKRLEDEIVRAQFQDPRIHAALNCASLGCPRLPRKAFNPEELDAMLDAGMREFVNNPNNAAVNRSTRTVTLSKIFDWFSEDFVGKSPKAGRSAALIDYINRYRDENDRIPCTYTVEFSEYDKRINKQ